MKKYIIEVTKYKKNFFSVECEDAEKALDIMEERIYGFRENDGDEDFEYSMNLYKTIDMDTEEESMLNQINSGGYMQYRVI